MKIGALTICFNEPTFIKPCIEQFEGFDIGHVVLVSKKPWRGDYEMDHTWAIAQMYNGTGLTEIGYWPDAAAQYNRGLEILEEQEYDWALIVDADEFYTPASLGQLIGELRVTEADAIKASYMHVYWKTPEYLIIPRQKDNPIIAIKPTARFEYIRNTKLDKIEMSAAELHHMSYVRSDEEMKKKIETSNHSHEFNTEQWFNEKWLKWTEDMEELHPVVPHQFKQAIRHPAPPEIRRLLNASL